MCVVVYIIIRYVCSVYMILLYEHMIYVYIYKELFIVSRGGVINLPLLKYWTFACHCIYIHTYTSHMIHTMYCGCIYILVIVMILIHYLHTSSGFETDMAYL